MNASYNMIYHHTISRGLLTVPNPGLTKAKEAAAAVKARLVVAEFANDEGEPTDFNDLYVREGAEKVKDAFLTNERNSQHVADDEKEDNKGGKHETQRVSICMHSTYPLSSNEAQMFFYKNENIRTAQIEGRTVFVLKDICDVLALSNPAEVAKRLNDNEKGLIPFPISDIQIVSLLLRSCGACFGYFATGLGISTIHTVGGTQKLLTITESGLCRLIMQSRKQEVRKFQRWIAHDVLPRIYREGAYIAPGSEKTTSSPPENAQEPTQIAGETAQNKEKTGETKKKNEVQD
jgi:prophage antirepressor-like protein